MAPEVIIVLAVPVAQEQADPIRVVKVPKEAKVAPAIKADLVDKAVPATTKMASLVSKINLIIKVVAITDSLTITAATVRDRVVSLVRNPRRRLYLLVPTVPMPEKKWVRGAKTIINMRNVKS